MIKLKMPGSVPGVAELCFVTEALQRVTGGTAKCCLTGGCLRDAYHGHEQVKDIDIAIWSLRLDEHEAFIGALEDLGFEPRDEFEDGLLASDAGSERIESVYAMVSPWPRAVDLLIYADHFVDMEHVVRSHDHNINMFGGLLTVAADGVLDVDVFYPWHNMGRTFQMRDNVDRRRINHIRTVSQRLGWTYWPDNKFFNAIGFQRLQELRENKELGYELLDLPF